MKKKGLDYFYIPTTNDVNIDLLTAKFGIEAYAIYIKLTQKIYNENGYYLQISKDKLALLKMEFCLAPEDDISENNISENNIMEKIIDFCTEQDIWNRELFEKYHILTSNEIQKAYLIATRKRKNIDIKKEYRLTYAKDYFAKKLSNKA